MDAPLYDVYLTGKLAENTSADQAAQRLAVMFKATPEVMAGMLTGKLQLLKRGVDKNTALKYREALSKAGVETAFKAQSIAPADIALATPFTPATTNTEKAAPESGLSLAPAGADLLQPSERAAVITAAIDVGGLELAPQSPLPTIASAPAHAPDTSYLTLAAVGADVLSAEERQHVPVATPDISELSLAPAGELLETLRSAAAPLSPDTSALSLAPAGTELLTAEQRNKPAPAAPSTDHLTLAN